MTDNLYTAQDARAKLKAGIDKVAAAVGATMGTGGSNAIIEAIESPGHLLTNDGYSIANSIVLADPIEDMGRKILLESINRANKASGDGSSTTCVLTAAIIEEGMKYAGKASPMEIKRQLEDCLATIHDSIMAQKRDITVDEIGKVATISAEDAAIGASIEALYKEIGPSGIIHWDISKTADDKFSIGTGLTVEGAGYYTPYMCDATESGQSANQVRLKDPYILITKQKISTAADFNAIGAELDGKSVKDLVVFCDDIDPLVVPDIVKTRMVRGFRFVLVKMPVLWKGEWFEDLALASGATVIEPASGLTLKQAKMEHLGRFGNITITKDDTFIDGIKDLKDHIADLDKMGDDASQLRISRLNTKTARYFVGAQSDSALSYRRLKVEDAISASYQALNGGIVPGGGVALMRTAFNLTGSSIGESILVQALQAPMRRIVENSGMDYDGLVITSDVNGIDTRKREQVNMFEAAIVDPTNVVLNAAKNAISVAATVLTANAVLTLPRQDKNG